MKERYNTDYEKSRILQLGLRTCDEGRYVEALSISTHYKCGHRNCGWEIFGTWPVLTSLTTKHPGIRNAGWPDHRRGAWRERQLTLHRPHNTMYPYPKTCLNTNTDTNIRSRVSVLLELINCKTPWETLPAVVEMLVSYNISKQLYNNKIISK